MRHGDAHRRFNMPKSQRRALFSNLTNALLTHEQITITLPRAKELRTFADNMITYAKKGDLNSRRLALAFLRDNEVVSKLFSTLAERYKGRNGGYTRVLKSGLRYGDCAPMAIIELVDRDVNAKGAKDLARRESGRSRSRKDCRIIFLIMTKKRIGFPVRFFCCFLLGCFLSLGKEAENGVF